MRRHTHFATHCPAYQILGGKAIPENCQGSGSFLAGIIYVIEKYKKITNWIGRFKYDHTKGSYSDLKGKIKFYIREELEKYHLEKKD